MTIYSFLARIAAEGDLAASAHEVLDLLYATGGAHDAELRVWEIASHPGRWRAQINHSRHYGDWHDTDSPEACIASVRASLPTNAVDRLAALRRRHERDFDAVARLFAVLRGAGNVCDVGAHVEALSRDQYARLRRRYFGFVFQGFHLLARTSAQENVELPLLYRGESAAHRRADAATGHTAPCDAAAGERRVHHGRGRGHGRRR